jgi:hypothetical protein
VSEGKEKVKEEEKKEWNEYTSSRPDAHDVRPLREEDLAERHLREAIRRVRRAALHRKVHLALVDVVPHEMPTAVNVACA